MLTQLVHFFGKKSGRSVDFVYGFSDFHLDKERLTRSLLSALLCRFTIKCKVNAIVAVVFLAATTVNHISADISS